MTLDEALITAARRYCKDNYTYWANRYAKERSGSDFPEYAYSDKDYDLFPRYNVLAAILGEVEMLVGKSFPALLSCRETLAHIGHAAQSLFTLSDNPIEAAAIQDEREKFIHYVETITPEELTKITPLPYRRRLNENERENVRQHLLDRWNYDGDYWDPLVEKSPGNILFLAKMHLSDADYQAIKDYICSHSTPYLLEITEEATDTEITCSEFHPDCYETAYCDYSYDWLLYGSYESTITFAGEQLLSFIRQLFAGREQLFNQWPE